MNSLTAEDYVTYSLSANNWQHPAFHPPEQSETFPIALVGICSPVVVSISSRSVFTLVIKTKQNCFLKTLKTDC